MRQVREHDYGVYVWITKNGERVEDSDGNVMNIPSRFGDIDKMARLRRAAEYYGVAEGGHPEFVSGARPVSQAEWEEQQARLRSGLIPDPLDYAALEEEARAAKKHGQ